MTKKHDLPAMPWYIGDWLKCPEVRALPLDYRALWFDMICFMWESTERGVMVKPDGKPYSEEEIVRMVGLDSKGTGFWLTYLLTSRVCYKREDGAFYSKRMVKDEQIRTIRRENGEKGGNPRLLVNKILKQEVNLNTEYENEYESEDVGVKERIVKENKSSVLAIFEYFCLKTGKKIILTAERSKIIEQRLKEGRTVDEMKQAIDNFSLDTWEDRHRFCDIVYCLGTRNKINNLDKWLTAKESSIRKGF